ncbi:hypothetical protein B0T17DRAFT_501693 [Bombardia bombarda]|uniref:ML-like domain-containing protein n=1 Tax=Bombardia bombarda TaxID=252184 RepID=A0AA39TLD4_9PEZI|nr:hypothetical protein B0T17DRAFT_501693 [Bombardia bombarda]
MASLWTKAQSRVFTLLFLLSALSVSIQAQATQPEYVYGTDGSGVTRQLAVDRYPALYTGDFGDCLGGESLFNITKFDAAYYADNLTIVFHLDGHSNIKNESLMMHISVEAYGSSRFDMAFNPCELNIASLCPLNASVPITGWALIPVGPRQIGGIPQIAFGIPDLEGFTKLRIFANSSQTEIGCFQAAMSNGNSFSHPEAIAPVLGIFTVVAILASFATAAYGVSIPHMRMHHAHSLSVFVVFETFQAIFFSGVLSLQWPSVCVAWWSNFAWSAGLIYTPGMIHSISSFVGVAGNASQVGGAGSVVINNGGGLLTTQIYGRSLAKMAVENVEKRSAYNASDPYDYTWSGNPVAPGTPLPGTWHGFPGALSGLQIPAADAFLLGLIWLLVAVGLVAVCTLGFKALLECLALLKWIKQDRLAYFRSHWIGYLTIAVLRSLFISFFMVMTLAVFQFAIGGSSGLTALASVFFVIVLVGITFLVAYACHVRTREGKFETKTDQIVFHRAKILRGIPGIVPAWASDLKARGLAVQPVFSISITRIQHINTDPARPSVHQDVAYVKRFGWLSARYRRTKWWFFAYYVGYLFIRAIFIGGGVQNPLAQVYGLLIFEIIAFGIIVSLNPFEGARNTAMAVWMLSITKIVTTGLSVAFLPAFNLDRIIATVIGIVIIIVQGLAVLALIVLMVLSAISSWMSLTRNHEDFSPESLEGVRVRYFERMEGKASDTYQPPPKSKEEKKDKKGKNKEKPQEALPPPPSSFSVVSVRRAPKIEDEDEDIVHDLERFPGGGPASSDLPAFRGATRASRTNSVSSRHSVRSVPRGARGAHRPSWPSRDFVDAGHERPDSGLAQRLSSGANGATMGSSGHHAAANDSVSSTIGPTVTRPQSSNQSLVSPFGARPSSSFSVGSGRATPTREMLARHADERRYATPVAIPDIEKVA